MVVGMAALAHLPITTSAAVSVRLVARKPHNASAALLALHRLAPDFVLSVQPDGGIVAWSHPQNLAHFWHLPIPRRD